MPFSDFSSLVTRRLALLSSQPELFEAGDSNTDLYDSYLEAFPAGTNPVFRERTEHDCNTCKQFVRGMGRMVAIVNGQIETVWGGEVRENAPSPYNQVAAALDDLLKSLPITSVYRTDQASYGTPSNRDNHDLSIVWTHLSGRVPRPCVVSDVGRSKGKINTAAQVLKRGLDEIREEDLTTVLELIDSNSLYKGSDYRKQIVEFKKLLTQYVQGGKSPLFHWANAKSPAACFRNSVIGTLLTDLASGDSIETAVGKFESKVAPSNYKRPSALITKGMVDQAMKTIGKLGLTDSLERRYAKLSDISVNDVLFVDNASQAKMKGGSIADLLMAEVKPGRIPANPTSITIQEFMGKGFKRIEVIPSRDNLSNLVTLTAPVYPDAPPLFKWGNGFGWSYNGNAADSIKQRVKKAGGNVSNAVLRCSLAWYNLDDLDIHCYTPEGGHIYYASKQWVLDVDMNAGAGRTREPVENLSWTKLHADGVYKIMVNCYARRETTDHGCALEVEDDKGVVQSYVFESKVEGMVHMLDLVVQDHKLVKVIPQAGVKAGTEVSVEMWGVHTCKPSLVTTIMKSPNHWEGTPKTGSLHWFFMLEGCACPEPSRSIYNEFLRGDLETHRKVFEVLGSKTRCEGAEQLAGLGFTHARNDTVNVLADGRPYLIAF